MRKKYIENSKDCYVTDCGKVFGTKGKVLKHGFNAGYPVVVITYNDGIPRTKRIHRLVAEAFLDPPTDEQWKVCIEKGYPYMCVNHKDGVKDNNHYTNLEWATYIENNTHAQETGLCKNYKGEKHGMATVTEEQVHEVCRRLVDNCRNVDIVRDLGISRSIVDQIRSGLNWKNISEQYNFPKRSRRRQISDSTAHWVCRCLEKGMDQGQIIKLSTCSNLTVGVIKTIRRRCAYHHITKEYKF